MCFTLPWAHPFRSVPAVRMKHVFEGSASSSMACAICLVVYLLEQLLDDDEEEFDVDR